MRGVKAICIAMGILSILLLSVALAMAWFAAALPAQQSLQARTPRFTARVQEATSCGMLKAVCTEIASGYDSQRATMTRLNRHTDQLLKTIAWFAAGWSMATALAFFYILRTVRARKTDQAAVQPAAPDADR